MAIDINKLMEGKKVECPLCKKGHFIPKFGAPPEEATMFLCRNCGEELIIDVKISFEKPL